MTVHPSQSQFLPATQPAAGAALGPIQREFNRLFDQLASGWNAFSSADLSPRMDVEETKDAIELTLELPGMKEDEINVALDDNVLTISGEKRSAKDVKEENFRLSERSFGAFSRSVSLPRNVAADKIVASMADGVLKITAPKDGTAAAKTIKVQSA